MASAAAWVAMCQPSATSAIEPYQVPPMISATIMTSVSATTHRVRRAWSVVVLAQPGAGAGGVGAWIRT